MSTVQTKDLSPSRTTAKQPEWFAQQQAAGQSPQPVEPTTEKKDDEMIVKPLPAHLRPSKAPAAPPPAAPAPTVRPISLIPIANLNSNRVTSPATFRRHDKLVASTRVFLDLLAQRRRAQLGEDLEGDLRLALHTVRDQCVANNREVIEKDCSLTASSPRQTSSLFTSDDRIGLEATLGVIFNNSLCFEGIPDFMSVQSLKLMLDKFRAAQATGDVRNFQRAVVGTINEILLYTPLDLERCLQAYSGAGGEVSGTRIVFTPATAEESKREGSPYKNASKERSVSQGNVSCATNVLRENEFNFFGFRESDENGNVVIKADECAPWKEHFLNGYASFLQRNDLLPKDSQASNEIYVVLPCEHWFSANTSYEQFIHLLVSCYFARGADLLNYTARVHKLVQYFELHLNWAAGTDCPSRPVEIINLDLLTNDGQSDMDYSNRELSESEDEMEEAVEDDGELDREADEEEPKEEEPQEEEEPEPPVEEQEEEKDEEEFDPEANIVVHFRESAPAPSGRPSGEEAPVEEEKPFVRRHKCYLAGEYPEKEGEGQRAHHATSVERDDDEEAAAEEPAAEEEQEEENESVESVPISHADENFKPPEGTVRKVREL